MLCVIAVSIVCCAVDRGCGVVGSKCAVVGITCGLDEKALLVWAKGVLVAMSSGVDDSAMLVWSGSAKVDVMTAITFISVVLGLRVTWTASLATRLALSMNPLVSSVSLTSESKMSCGQCLMKYWEKFNSVARVSLLSM